MDTILSTKKREKKKIKKIKKIRTHSDQRFGKQSD